MEISEKTTPDNLVDAINRVAAAGERVVLTRKKKRVAALVSLDDLAALERLEDIADARAARRALAEMKRKGQKAIPLAEVKNTSNV
jgi:PHD/YefM family antitoxin component YafN of YafNO toxin-antitoxin module